MRIGALVQTNQSGTYRHTNKKNNKKKRKRRGCINEHLSFSDIDKLMREQTDIDETKCIGR